MPQARYKNKYMRSGEESCGGGGVVWGVVVGRRGNC